MSLSKNIDFINRLKDPNREVIQDWADLSSIATHKMGWSDDGIYGYVYPSVQKDKRTGKLIDYTAPPYSLEAAEQEAYKTGEMLKMKKEFADWFTQNYKKLGLGQSSYFFLSYGCPVPVAPFLH